MVISVFRVVFWRFLGINSQQVYKKDFIETALAVELFEQLNFPFTQFFRERKPRWGWFLKFELLFVTTQNSFYAVGIGQVALKHNVLEKGKQNMLNTCKILSELICLVFG